MRLPSPPLLLITDGRQARLPLEDVVAAAIEGGCRWVSLREKDLSPADRLELLLRLIEIGRPSGTKVTVHEDINAGAAGAAGVHLPSGGSPARARRRLGADALIGLSTHRLPEIARAAEDGADYVTLSPVFATTSKPGYGPALGLVHLREACAATRIPVVALGGIGSETARACLEAGASGVAVMGGIMGAADPAAATAKILAAMAASPG